MSQTDITHWQPRLDREEALKALEINIAENPTNLKLRFESACLLTSLGRIEEAKQTYFGILSVDPKHLGTLNNFGALLYEAGYRSAAMTVCKQAVMHHPDDAAAHANLATLLFDGGDLATARRHYEEALRIDPDQAQAHQGLTRIFSSLRDEAGVQRHRERGFRHQAVTVLPYFGKEPPVRLLLLVAAEGGNIPLRQHIDNHVFMTTAIFADFFDAGKPLPPHDLVMNSIGDSDLCRPALEAAVRLLTSTSAPVINSPQKVLMTGRLENAQRLSGLEGVRTARTLLLSKRQVLQQKEMNFPLLLRAPGFHTGQHFVKVDRSDQLSTAVAQLPGDELLAMEYFDARGDDGMTRKYRVMMIGGKLYPLHIAISADWKVHYFTAAMAGQRQHQAEEKRFLEDMSTVIGPRGMAALEQVKTSLDLDYGGIDFGLDKAGNILLFEANATMVIYPPPAEEQWDYRRKAIEAASRAVRELLRARTLLRKNVV